uniref:Uncharacterized protein n=1 Tax=Opuntia streptacantha TaxID=393608 RepID=A0A7C8YG77_OPUST
MVLNPRELLSYVSLQCNGHQYIFITLPEVNCHLTIVQDGFSSSVGSNSHFPKPMIKSRWSDSNSPCCLTGALSSFPSNCATSSLSCREKISGRCSITLNDGKSFWVFHQ